MHNCKKKEKKKNSMLSNRNSLSLGLCFYFFSQVILFTVNASIFQCTLLFPLQRDLFFISPNLHFFTNHNIQHQLSMRIQPLPDDHSNLRTDVHLVDTFSLHTCPPFFF